MRTTLATLFVAGTIVASAVQPADAHELQKDWDPCKQEDSRNCVWDARHMGNGEGRSFLVRKGGKRVFITHRRAHHLIKEH